MAWARNKNYGRREGIVTEKIIKQYFELANKKAYQVRRDVEEIRGQLNVLSCQLDQNLFDEETLSQKIKKVRSAHQSFHNRMEQMGQTLRAYKTFLASFDS